MRRTDQDADLVMERASRGRVRHHESPDTMMPAMISVQIAGRLLGVCTASAYDAARSGQLPVLRLGARRLLVPTARLREMLGCTVAELARQIADAESAHAAENDGEAV